jgi:hypothetical protein
MYAASGGHLEVARLLMERGADITAEDNVSPDYTMIFQSQ